MEAVLTVIAGPTGSGKSALALALAERLGAGIVSADSQQVYRCFDIGTAKPSPSDLAHVPHHLVSAAEPLEPFSAARYQALADAALKGIASRSRPALVVGGTGLYLRALLHGLIPTPAVDSRLRQELENEARTPGGKERLHARLMEVDPDTARRLPPADVLRVVRALEISAQTGEPASQRRKEHAFTEDRYPYRLFVLNPPRDALYQAIDERTRRMFASGLVDEVASLVARGFREAPPMKSVGYRQALAVLDGGLDLAAAIASTAQESRKYAKRQLTWFRKERGAVFVDPPYRELQAE